MGIPGRPDDRLRETHHLQLCYTRAVTNYRRNFICGGCFFFTANLAERRLRLLAMLRIFYCESKFAFVLQ
jgi:hypothetical protein